MLFYLRLLLRACRAGIICLIYLPAILLAYGFYGLRRKKQKKKQAYFIVHVIKKLGPAYVKMGQFLATRPDIIGADFAESLSELQDKMPSFSQVEAVKILRSEWRGKGQEVIDNLTPSLAAASIAQVHKSFWIDDKGNRQYVAIKILRPHLEKKFLIDVYVFKLVAKIIEYLVPSKRRLKPVTVIESLIKSVRMEMDLRFEAAAMQEMREYNINHDTAFFIPSIYWPLTSHKVLVSDWVDGMAFTNIEAIKSGGYDCKKLAQQLMQGFLKNVVEDGFFHADMHQGNVFALPNEKIALVDFGITGRLDKLWRRYYAEIIYSFIVGDYQRGARVHFEAGYVPHTEDPYVFAQALRSIADPIQGAPSKDISIANLLMQLLEITDLFNMQTQEKLLLLQKNMIIVEGLCRQLDPDIDIWQISQPIMEQAIRDKLNPCGIGEAITESVQWHYLPLLRKLPDYLHRLIDKPTETKKPMSFAYALLWGFLGGVGFFIGVYSSLWLIYM